MNMIPHAHCLLDDKVLIVTDVLSNLLIFLAYMIISSLLFSIRRNGRLFASFREFLKTRAPQLMLTPEIAQWWFASFATFIATCGLTHLMDIIVIWVPLYWPQAAVTFLNALASASTAYFLVRVVHANITLMRKQGNDE